MLESFPVTMLDEPAASLIMYQSSARSRHLAVVVVFLLSAGMTYYHVGLFLPHAIAHRAEQGLGGGYSFGDDFYPIWLTSREALLHHRNPYTTEMTRSIQVGLFGRPLDLQHAGDPPVNYRAFAYPAYVELLFWPLSLFPFPALRVGLAIVLAVLTAASVLLWMQFLGLRASSPLVAIAMMFTLSSYATLEGLFATQPGLLVAFLLAATFAALLGGRLFLAGSLFSFTFIKPQIPAIVAVYLLLWITSDWHKRRTFAYAFLAWSALLGTASLVVWPHWVAEWLHVLSGYGGYSQPPLITYSLGPKMGPLLGGFLTAALLLAAMILMWKMRNVAATSQWFALTICLLLALTSITILPGQAVHDHLMLLPGIFLTAWTWRRWSSLSRSLAVVVAAVALALFWQWITVIPLLALRYFLPPAQFFSNKVLLLPLHAAASIPLGVTAALGYMTAKGLRQKRFEDQPSAPPLTHAGPS